VPKCRSEAGDEVVWFEAPGTRYINNTPTGGGATGGGVSQKNQRPAWQSVAVASINKPSLDGRVIPDVAALAGVPGYALHIEGKWVADGGTSASAPLWASLVARVNAALPSGKKRRFLTPLLYSTVPDGRVVGEAISRDITIGQNASSPYPGIGYSAGPGFDAASGWGVPDGQRLLAALQLV
jgi:kumamolisin